MKKVYIWGTGHEAEKCLSYIEPQRCEVMGYIETNPQKKFWRDRRVYSMNDLSHLQYDYLIIASSYYQEIMDAVLGRRLADQDRIINWTQIFEYIYTYSEEIRTLFSNCFWENNCYIFNQVQKCSDKNKDQISKGLLEYNKIFIYDLRLIDNELDIVTLMSEILDKKRNNAGMAFIPNEDYLDENWYHNLICVLDKYAFVIWSNLESIYAECMRVVPEKFSYAQFNVLQFKRMRKKIVKKGKRMFFDTTQVYGEKQKEINEAKYIEIHCLWSDRIGEEIRIVNKILFEEHDRKDVFELYVPIDVYGKPSDGANACFNELIGRRINLLKNKEEYAFWIQDVFAKSEKYNLCGWITAENLNNFKIEKRIPIIDFNHEEIEEGKELIKKYWNISNNYVCLFTRDQEYLKYTTPQIDWAYHDYRDASFEVMNKAIDYFDNCKIQTVRVGQIVEQKEIHEKCINFANQEYDEFIDLMLHRNCKFFLGSGSGVLEITHVFGKPTVCLMANYPSLDFYQLSFREDLIIFNRIFDLNKGKELSFSELFRVAIEFRTQKEMRGEYFAERALKLLPFTQEDVLDVAIEMNEKLDGIWKVHDKDIELHNRFDKLLKKVMEEYKINPFQIYLATVATSFLRRYEYLLDDGWGDSFA